MNVTIRVVTFEVDALARNYAASNDIPGPLWLDPQRVAYKAMAMGRAGRRDIWNFKTLWAYLRAMWRGQRLQKSDSDIHQRGGDILIDSEGLIRLHHVGSGPADRPSVESIIARVQPLLSAPDRGDG